MNAINEHDIAKISVIVVENPELPTAVESVYQTAVSLENKLGGGEGVEGLYGRLTVYSMHKIMLVLQIIFPFVGFFDAGAGVGIPVLHAMVMGFQRTCGAEVDTVKHDKALSICTNTFATLACAGKLGHDTPIPDIVWCDLEKLPVSYLAGISHVYSFWEGIPESGKKALGSLVTSAMSVKAVAVVQRATRMAPSDIMLGYGFPMMTYVISFPVAMSGKGRKFTAYVFKRTD